MRIAIGGFGHETNTFTSLRTRLSDFTIWRGEQVMRDSYLDDFKGQAGVELIPTINTGAPSGGLIERGTYLQLRDELLASLRGALPLDGVYLTLHGAGEVEGIGDLESDLLRQVRAVVGPKVKISCSLDLHGNIAPEVAALSDILTGYRTAPHRDTVETRKRGLALLIQCLREKMNPKTALIRLPILIPGEFAVTEVEPAKTLYGLLSEVDRKPGILDSTLMCGCAYTDAPFTSMTVLVVGRNGAAEAQREAARYAAKVWQARHSFKSDFELLPVDDAIRRAMTAPQSMAFITDTGDNVTAGTSGDIPVMLERLLALGARDAVLAGLCDPQAVDVCAEKGEGAQVTLNVGGKTDPQFGKPFPLRGKVAKVDRGSLPPGASAGSGALVQCAGVEVILTRTRHAFTNLSDFRPWGIDPLRCKIVVVKQGYLFPDLRDVAPLALSALSPGCSDLCLERLTYSRLTRPIFPLDKNLEWNPPDA